MQSVALAILVYRTTGSALDLGLVSAIGAAPAILCNVLGGVLADRHDQYQLPYEETLAFNPGSFASDFAWMVYRPCAKMEAERSSLS